MPNGQGIYDLAHTYGSRQWVGSKSARGLRPFLVLRTVTLYGKGKVMYRQGTKLVMDRHKCWSCAGSGERPTVKVPCPKCEGTGRGPRGGRRGCRKCNGGGYDYLRPKDLDIFLPGSCKNCEGSGTLPDNLYDTLPQDVWENLDFRVVRTDRGQGWVESYIGVGCYSSTDYGDQWKANDAPALITKVRERENRPQCIKVARYLCPTCGEVAKPRWVSAYDDDHKDFTKGHKVGECLHPNLPEVWENSNELCDAVVINVHPRGYTVLGVFYERSAGRETVVDKVLV